MATKTGPVLPSLWIDDPDADARIAAAGQPGWLVDAARALARDGLVVLRGAQPRELCERAIADYGDYCGANARYVAANLDGLGHEKRLVNFHRTSEAALALGLNARVMQLLDFVFGAEAGVYTSLTFKYGTQQPVHRDTPHFATWPGRYFCGCWTALRDVDPAAGPLFYYRGAHRPVVAAAPFLAEAKVRNPRAGRAELLALALDLYNGEVIRRAPEWGELVTPELAQGDVVVWHAETPHGGSPAQDPELLRWSIVFHCAPRVVQVHQHDAFFGHVGELPPRPRYGTFDVGGRAVGVTGDTAFM
ncbi:MAG: phytanoyl-CoA dioxygenase family protein [Planctomycetes bacterium]|nr:phytanoyl-CoA dioxygenase family protein [Planctomycetota bacterium]